MLQGAVEHAGEAGVRVHEHGARAGGTNGLQALRTKLPVVPFASVFERMRATGAKTPGFGVRR